MPAVEVERGLPRKSPSRDRPAHDLQRSQAMWTGSHEENAIKALPRFDRTHVAYPLDEIEGYGSQSKDRYKSHQDQVIRRRLEAEAEGGEDQCREGHLRHRVEFRYHQRFHRNRFAEQPRHDHGGHDHDVARDHENDDPAWYRAPDTKRHIDRDQQRLVRERIEQRPQFAGHIEALGEKTVDRVANARDDEDRKSDFHLVGGNRPHDNRHQQDATERNDIWNTHGASRLPA